jgi:hypothetical protein
MKVVSTKTGFYGGNLIHPGIALEIDDAVNEAGEVIAFSEKWMVRYEDAVKVAAGPSPEDPDVKLWVGNFLRGQQKTT